MKQVIGIFKLVLIYFLATFLTNWISLPVGLIGMVILYLGLSVGVVSLGEIDFISNLSLKHMSFFFIPLAVGIITSLTLIDGIIIELLIIILITTVLVMGVTSKVVDLVLKGSEK